MNAVVMSLNLSKANGFVMNVLTDGFRDIDIYERDLVYNYNIIIIMCQY